jgi:hypothetical protein
MSVIDNKEIEHIIRYMSIAEHIIVLEWTPPSSEEGIPKGEYMFITKLIREDQTTWKRCCLYSCTESDLQWKDSKFFGRVNDDNYFHYLQSRRITLIPDLEQYIEEHVEYFI